MGTLSLKLWDNPDEVEQHEKRLANAGFELVIPYVKNPPGYADFSQKSRR